MQFILQVGAILAALYATGSGLSSCKEAIGTTKRSGVYTLNTTDGLEYQTYCDMITNGGGWTLVASIHENNAHDNGKCTVGDKWSSEQGNSEFHPHGDGNWENLETFGNVASATSGDFKSSAYFSIDDAKDIMIWQIPNNIPLSLWRKNSYLRYRTYDNFLISYGGNLYSLYKNRFLIKDEVFNWPGDNGPSFPVVFDEGSAADVLSHFGTGSQPYLTAGYIQFRPVSSWQHVNAICPGIKVDPSMKENHVACIGGTSYWGEESNCGDFGGFILDGYGTGLGRSVDKTLIETTFLIFYRVYGFILPQVSGFSDGKNV